MWKDSRKFLGLLFVITIILAVADNVHAKEYDDFIILNVDTFSESQTLSTLYENLRAFIFNPSAVSRTLLPAISHSHSMRHFPRTKESDPEMDQVDADIEAIIFPLLIGRVGYAFSLMDELGYDYSNHPPGRFVYPRDKLQGSESLIAYAVGALPLNVGASLRRYTYFFFPASKVPARSSPFIEALSQASWIKFGQAESVGLLAGLPWFRAGLVREKVEDMKIDFTRMLKVGGKKVRMRMGLRLFPTSWLSVAWEEVSSKQTNPESSAGGSRYQLSSESSFSASLNATGFLKASLGSIEGKRSFGITVNVGSITLKYSEAKEFLQKIVGWWGRFMLDLHFYGFDVILL